MLLRNPTLTVMRVAQVLGMSFFFCSVFFQMSQDEKDPLTVFNRNGSLFFAVVSSFIPAMMSQLITSKFSPDFRADKLVPAERKVFVKEYKSRFYSVFPYFVAKNLIEVPFSFIFPMAYTSIIYYISGFHSPIENFLKFGKGIRSPPYSKRSC